MVKSELKFSIDLETGLIPRKVFEELDLGDIADTLEKKGRLPKLGRKMGKRKVS